MRRKASRRKGDGTKGIRARVASSSRLLSFIAAITLAPATSLAQRGIAREALLNLLLPVGARATASGQSVASADVGTEQLYWNPSGIARAPHAEMALHYGKFFIGPQYAFTAVIPFKRAGVVGASIGILDYGTQDVVDHGVTVGSFSQQSYVLGATYAATLGSRASLGFTFKNARLVASCSGLCPQVVIFHVSSSAVDAGLQYRPATGDNIVLALAVRNAGLRFQVNDDAQADPLPTRIQAGMSMRLHWLDRELPGSELRANLDIIDRPRQLGDAAFRGGVEMTYRKAVSLRTGYVVGSGEGTGFGIGFGLINGRGAVDLAQTFSGSGETARSSSYVSLRYHW